MNSLNEINKTLEKDIEMKFKVIFVVRSAGTYCDPTSQVLAEFESDVEELDEQHKVDIVDSGWMEYLTKELGMKDTDNVLWDLA